MSDQKRISVAAPMFRGNEKKYVNDCIDSTWISSAGKYIGMFEAEFAKFLGVKHAIACNNGTTSLHAAVHALGIGPGDEVIVPTFTYIASANCVTYCGAKPVLCDCNRQTWNMEAPDIEAMITERTKAIMTVPLYGNPIDMDAIMTLAKKYGLYVIEDAAEAHGATFAGKKMGSFGQVSSFSLFGNKIITSGEGGVVVTDDDELNAKIRIMKGQGQDPTRRYWFIEVGYNYRMTNIEAALALAQLEHVDEHLAGRLKVADMYLERLNELEREGLIEFQMEQPGGHHVYWMFSILLGEGVKGSRDEFMAYMDAQGIETRPLFYPLHIMPPYFIEGARFENAEEIAGRGVNLPTHGGLAESDVDRVCEAIRGFVKA